MAVDRDEVTRTAEQTIRLRQHGARIPYTPENTVIRAAPIAARWPGTWDSWGHPYCVVFDAPSPMEALRKLQAQFPGYVIDLGEHHPKAPVIRAWPNGGREWSVQEPFDTTVWRHDSAADLLIDLRQNFPGHTIDLSAEPPEGMR